MTPARNRIAVYPGTFDPITNGHVDLVNRAARLFDHLILGVAESPAKRPALPLELRVRLAREAVAHHPPVEVIGLDSLLADFVAEVGAGWLLRGTAEGRRVGDGCGGPRRAMVCEVCDKMRRSYVER